ncbi:carbon-nitrogen hydrolase family protein [Candidatus Colwellia aromaticivorans]|uniref:carbon-nitrogen hydrolase family protein n=1 Tax=Candidatus Colwellia aromaticivorans TaxID=2267621 RepID=UPI000DF3D07E|nr:carbon-nitrogen hydrolase family protein [Candidatus Colwellia aromaticivorans]
MVKLSAIQLNSTPNVEQNIDAIAKQLARLTQTSNSANVEHIVVLPECCLFFGASDQAQLSLAQQSKSSSKGNNELQLSLSQLAKQYKVTLIGGTIPIVTEGGDKFTNTCCAYNSLGELITSYDKIHLFDVNVADSEKTYYESRYTQAGNKACIAKTPLANIGLSVCFDIRFPLLYQKLRELGADIITVPSAFTRVTGKVHWQALLQVRAIENQVYIIAAGQEGVHANGRETWGHSMIISPWGEILTCLEQGEGIVTCDYIPSEIQRIRTSMPLIPNEIMN